MMRKPSCWNAWFLFGIILGLGFIVYIVSCMGKLMFNQIASASPMSLSTVVAYLLFLW